MKRNILRVTICLLLALVISSGVFTVSAASNIVWILKCNVDGGRLHDGPSSAYQVVTSAKKGEKLFFMGETEDAFCYVSNTSGAMGYIYRGFLEFYGAARYDQLFYAGYSGAKLYKQPSAGAKSSGYLAGNEIVIAFKVVGDWAYVKSVNGKWGFIPISNLNKL